MNCWLLVGRRWCNRRGDRDPWCLILANATKMISGWRTVTPTDKSVYPRRYITSLVYHHRPSPHHRYTWMHGYASCVYTRCTSSITGFPQTFRNEIPLLFHDFPWQYVRIPWLRNRIWNCTFETMQSPTQRPDLYPLYIAEPSVSSGGIAEFLTFYIQNILQL